MSAVAVPDVFPCSARASLLSRIRRRRRRVAAEPNRAERSGTERSVASRRARLPVGLLSKSAAIADSGAPSLSLFSLAMPAVASTAIPRTLVIPADAPRLARGVLAVPSSRAAVGGNRR